MSSINDKSWQGIEKFTASDTSAGVQTSPRISGWEGTISIGGNVD